MKCNECNCDLVKINGRTLREAIDSVRAPFEREFRLTEWVSICPFCDRSVLGTDTLTPYPFLCSDGVMRVTTDFEHNKCRSSGDVLSFAGFNFSRAAFYASIASAAANDSRTGEVEKLGRLLVDSPSAESAYEFSRRVCEWGRGHRVWGNLNRFHTKDELGRLISDWLSRSPGLSPRESISVGAGIRGLGVSFASKHLRLAFPDRFGVLDEVISKGFGLALNEAGYNLFHELLGEFKRKFAQERTIAEIESGLFMLVRQGVRATS